MIKTALRKSNLFKETLNYSVKNLEILSDVLMKNSLDLFFDIEQLCHFLRTSFALLVSCKWNDNEKI